MCHFDGRQGGFSVVQDNGKDPETFLTFYNIARFFLSIC